MSRIGLFARVAACAILAPFSAHAVQVSSASGAGCLDINMGAPTGGGGAGRDVIVWPNCHGGPNQSWEYDDASGVVWAEADGQTWRLDIDMGAPAGGGGAGRNVIAWPNCHGGANQIWCLHEDGTVISEANGRVWRLDVNMGQPAGAGGSGRDVIAWPNCHGGANQIWIDE